MKNPNFLLKGQLLITLTGLLISSLLILPFSSVSGQGNGIVVAPSSVHVPASPGMTMVNISFTQDPVFWVAIPQSIWLNAQPENGEIPGSVAIQFSANTGPAREGQVLFHSPDPGVTPFILTVMQNQGLNPASVPFEWHQVTNPNIDPQSIPNTGSVSLNYLPWTSPVFLNIIARNSISDPPAWLVRNVYLPDASWIALPQSLWLPVDLGLLGYAIGQPVEFLEYSWTVSFEPDISIPNYPDRVWTPSLVVPETVDAVGRAGLLPFAGTPVTDYYTNLVRPFVIQDLIYIGCDMPNQDLDDGTRPGELNGCGPVSAANSLAWLDKHNDDFTIPADAFNQLSSLMRSPGAGTNDPDFIRAKLDFIEMYDLPIKVKYQDDGMEGNISSSSGNSSATCHDASAGAMPTKAWMIGEAQDDEDVEVGMTFPGGSGHWVVLTGVVTIDGKTTLIYKDDKRQRIAGGNTQSSTPINETPGGMVLPGISNGKVDIVVSESYDPDHVPVASSFSFGSYCKSSKRTLPPGASITLTYPDNESRCFNTSVRVLNHGTKRGYELKAVWNHNSGKERTYVNDTGEPVTVEFHNDDHYNGSEPRLKAYVPYIVSTSKSFTPGGATTDPSNEETYAGFSIGSDDDSPDEFGDIAVPQVDYSFGIGSFMSDFPERMHPAGCNIINVDHTIVNLNRYWNQLGLVVGVHSVTTPGVLSYSSVSTGISGTIPITVAGEYTADLGGVMAGSVFDLTLQSDGNLDFIFDNMGVPSLVQVSHTLDLKVFLEGALNPLSGVMNTTLNTSPQIIPLTQPYNFAPWNYPGLESVATIPSGVVDWILVELRDAATPAAATSGTKLPGWPKAFFLIADGTVVDLDGTSLPAIGTPAVANNLFVVVRHRNHLSVMSATGIPMVSGNYSYDFTTGLAQVYGGGGGYKMAGIYAVMVAGDIDHDGNIFVSDFNGWAAGFGSGPGYYFPDIDMDRNVFVSDFNKWATNFGSFVPVNVKSGILKPRYTSWVPK